MTIEFERTTEGLSCQVYRITRGTDRYYLRVAEERSEDLTVDADILRQLLRAGVRVPDVIHVVPFDQNLERSALIMSEVEGIPLAEVQSPDVAARVVREAGADVAALNAVQMNGFGWLDRRRPGLPPCGQLGSYAEFVESNLLIPSLRRERLEHLLSGNHLARIEAIISAARVRPLSTGRLAHGDLDATHIYCDNGSYTGIIDFSEFLGAEPRVRSGSLPSARLRLGPSQSF